MKSKIQERVMQKLGRKFLKKLTDPHWEKIAGSFEAENHPDGFPWKLRITLIPPSEAGKVGGEITHKMIGRSMAGYMMGGIAMVYRLKRLPKFLERFCRSKGLQPGKPSEIAKNRIALRYVKGDDLIHYIDIHTENKAWAEANKEDLDKTWEMVMNTEPKKLLKSNPFAFGYRAFFNGGGVLTGKVMEV